MKKADLMVALGERMTDTVTQSYSFPAAPQPQLPSRACVAGCRTRSVASGGSILGCRAAHMR